MVKEKDEALSQTSQQASGLFLFSLRRGIRWEEMLEYIYGQVKLMCSRKMPHMIVSGFERAMKQEILLREAP